MVASVEDRFISASAATMRVQTAFTILGFVATQLKVANVNPLALGIAFQSFGKVLHVVENRLLRNRSDDLLGCVIGGSLICATYTLVSQTDPMVQAIAALAYLIFDFNTIGLKNIWKELKIPGNLIGDDDGNASRYERAAIGMRSQVGFACLALLATTLRIANLEPLAAGFAANCSGRKELKFLNGLPQVIQMAAIGGVACVIYGLMTNLSLKSQAISFGILLALDIVVIKPENVWKELKA